MHKKCIHLAICLIMFHGMMFGMATHSSNSIKQALNYYVALADIPYPVGAPPRKAKLAALTCALRLQEFMVSVAGAVFECSDFSKSVERGVLKTAQNIENAVKIGFKKVEDIPEMKSHLKTYAFCTKLFDFPTPDTHHIFLQIAEACRDLNIFNFAMRFFAYAHLSEKFINNSRSEVSGDELFRFFMSIRKNICNVIVEYNQQKNEITKWQNALAKMLGTNKKEKGSSQPVMQQPKQVHSGNPRKPNRKKNRKKGKKYVAPPSKKQSGVDKKVEAGDEEQLYLSTIPTENRFWGYLPDEESLSPQEIVRSEKQVCHEEVLLMQNADECENNLTAQEILVNDFLGIQNMFCVEYLGKHQTYLAGKLTSQEMINCLRMWRGKLLMYKAFFADVFNDSSLDNLNKIIVILQRMNPDGKQVGDVCNNFYEICNRAVSSGIN